ncbi:MAG TPA: hypothetical protein VIZ31_05300 [Vicinamibacteria bacterium]
MDAVDVDWTDLQTRGFVVLRSFLPPETVAEMRDVYERARRNETLYFSMVAKPGDVQGVRERLSALLPGINAGTDIKTDLIHEDGFFFPTEYTNLSWHTDHKSFYALQDHYHYLNFWMPITKPRPDKSGLGLVPMDKLKDAAPKAFGAVVRRGAAAAQDGTLHYEDDGKVRTVQLQPGLLDEIGVAPDVVPGDLIVARTDVLHRTQDAETIRVALTMRGVWSQQLVSRRVLLRGSPAKHQRMLAEPVFFRSLLASFWIMGKEQITLAESSACQERIKRRELRATLVTWAVRLLFPLVLFPHRLRGMKDALGSSYARALVQLLKLDRAYRKAAREMRQKGAPGAGAATAPATGNVRS